MSNNLVAPAKTRLSPIELLRIVAMFLILIQHVNYQATAWTRADDFHTTTAPTVTRVVIEQTAVCAVNLFVLISGWFSIHVKRESLFTLLVQYFFFATVLLVFPGLSDACSPGDLKDPIRQVVTFDCFWFVPAYLMLCLLSPGLNAFVEQGNRRTVRAFIVAFFVFQTVWGWALGDAASGMFSCGYSAISFTGLYLLARYVRLYRPRPFQLRACLQYLIAGILIALPALASFIAAFAWGGGLFDAWYGRSILYSAPHVILCALFILTATARLHFTSQWINKVAASAFAVYLFHLHPCVFPYFKQATQWLYGHYSGAAYLLLTFGFLVTVFAAAVLVDQIRILCWRPLARRLFSGRMSA